MARDLNSKCKQCRRIGEKLFLKGERCFSQKCAIIKRNYPPGPHGGKGKRRQSDYGLQLQEKQKAKKQYHLLEKQFKLTFDRAEKQNGDTGENLLKLLEMRLDSVVYRLGFVSSFSQARQLVTHGYFKVNGKKIDIPSYQVKIGDVISIGKGGGKSKFLKAQDKLKKDEVPGWLNLNIKEMSGKVLHSPKFDDIKGNINPHIVVEYYSR